MMIPQLFRWAGERCGCSTRLLEPGEVLTCEAYMACITRPPTDGFFSAETAQDYVEEAG